MTNERTDEPADDITSVGDQAVPRLRALAIEFRDVARRLDETADRLSGLRGDVRRAAIRSACHWVRLIGDGCHDLARAVEDFILR